MARGSSRSWPLETSGETRTRASVAMLNKVPEITVYFWVIKVLCTTVGETFADYLNDNLGLGLTKHHATSWARVLIVALVFQFRARKYVPGIYWLGGRADQRRRHPDQRQPGRQLRRRAGDDDDRLQRSP